MKARSFRYLTGEGIKSAWANRLMSLASVGVLVACMVIIGLFILLYQNASRALGAVEKQNVVLAYMKDYTWALYGGEVEKAAEGGDENGILPDSYVIHNEDEALEYCKEIEKLDNVESVEYISPQDALERETQNMKDRGMYVDSILGEEYGNPYSGAAKVTMKGMDDFSDTVEAIKKMDATDSVEAQSDLADSLFFIKRGLTTGAIWIFVILLIISFVVVSNTIRITMYSRKLEISIMKAVGATDAFVRIPFVIEGIFIGLLSAVISEGLLYFCYRVATETLLKKWPKVSIVSYADMALILFGIFVAIGLFAGVICSFFMIRKYLRREGSEFSAI